jgi:hypothetical protein
MKMENYVAAQTIAQEAGLPEDEVNMLFVERDEDDDLGGEDEEDVEEGSEGGGGGVNAVDNDWVDYLDVEGKVWEEKILAGIRYLARVCYPHVPGAEETVVTSFMAHMGREGITTTPFRIDAGVNSNSDPRKSSSLSFWESLISLPGSNSKNLLLAQLAKAVFCIPASEAPCERIFSRLKLLIGDRRRRLNATTAFYLLLLSL